MIRALALTLLFGITTAHAKDWIAAEGPLGDDAFYKLVACGARPGEDCDGPILRWPTEVAADLTIAIARVDPGYPPLTRRLVGNALDAALTSINGAGTSLRLRRLSDGEDAHITLFLMDIADGEKITGTGLNPLDGNRIGAAHVQIWWQHKQHITRGVIVVARDIEHGGIPSVLLEEVVQSLGFLTDINDPWYDTRSVFSQNGNFVTDLGAQDRMALSRHYPPAE